MKLLIVDDVTYIRSRIQKLCKSIGADLEIYEADDVEPGIAAVDKYKPDIILLDLNMPGGSGIQILKRVRELKLRSKVIIFTNYSSQTFEKQCRQLGADYFLDKALQFNELKTILLKSISHN